MQPAQRKDKKEEDKKSSILPLEKSTHPSKLSMWDFSFTKITGHVFSQNKSNITIILN